VAVQDGSLMAHVFGGEFGCHDAVKGVEGSNTKNVIVRSSKNDDGDGLFLPYPYVCELNSAYPVLLHTAAARTKMNDGELRRCSS
jgi:hypothetical protein